MEYNVNAPILFVLVGVIIAVVLAQSVFFLVRAYRHGKEIGVAQETLKRTVVSSILFTIAPAIAILVGVIALAKSLGVAIPWLRLSVIGSLSYETVAATTTIETLGLSAGDTIASADAFVTVLWVMTTGILAGLVLVPLLTKKIQSGLITMEKRDKNWTEILYNSMFIGMISAFLGYVFADVSTIASGSLEGLVPVCVFFAAAVVMTVLGLFSKKLKARWLTDYALPISLIAGMALAIPFSAWLV